MKLADKIDCPVDFVKVDDHRVRVGAFIIVLLASAFLFSRWWFIPVFLLIDFLLRGFNLAAYSPVNIISGWIVKVLNIKPKPVDRAPKRFAALTGATFSAFIIITLFAGLSVAAFALAAMLMLFACLESIAGFCAGCYVYSLLKLGRK